MSAKEQIVFFMDLPSSTKAVYREDNSYLYIGINKLFQAAHEARDIINDILNGKLDKVKTLV